MQNGAGPVAMTGPASFYVPLLAHFTRIDGKRREMPIENPPPPTEALIRAVRHHRVMVVSHDRPPEEL
jgi:hypothetical protein